MLTTALSSSGGGASARTTVGATTGSVMTNTGSLSTPGTYFGKRARMDRLSLSNLSRWARVARITGRFGLTIVASVIATGVLTIGVGVESFLDASLGGRLMIVPLIFGKAWFLPEVLCDHPESHPGALSGAVTDRRIGLL